MTEKDNLQNSRNLYSLISLIFFAPLVDNLLKDVDELNSNDLSIIKSYKKAGYFIYGLILLTIIILLIYIRYHITFLSYVLYIIVSFIVMYIIYNIYLIFKNKGAILFSGDDIKSIKINSIKAGNIDYLLLYLPFINEYLYQSKKFTKEQEYWLKESILLYFLLSVIGIISIALTSNIWFFFLFIFIIIARIISLFFGMDILADNFKKMIYESFDKRSVELFSYICAGIRFIFSNLFLILIGKKTYEYGFYLHKAKEFLKYEYETKSVFKKGKKYIYLIISYILIILIFMYLLYISWYSFNPYIYILSVFIMLNNIFLIVYLKNMLYNIPFISGVLLNILKKFN